MTLSRFAHLSERDLHLRCVALIGAAEALAADTFRGRADEHAAAKALESRIVQWPSNGG